MVETGYVWEWCPTHPKARHGSVAQHRLVMECQIGRFLSKNEHVHHRNSVRHDNRPENLEVHGSHAQHMQEQWKNRGSNDPALIAKVREYAADPSKNISSLGVSPTTVKKILDRHQIPWIRSGHFARTLHLTDDIVREALQGRSAVQAAAHLGVNAMTLYNRFSHLLQKRTKPGYLDQFRDQVLRMRYEQKLSFDDIARQFGVSDFCVTKSIRRWSTQDAKQGGPVLPSPIRLRPGPKPSRKVRDRPAPPQ
jgi:transposase-like protein